ncbi:MAG: hypothetical protein QG646_727 [Euryarchaeota archaeon]|nr:hypothetical protein [Euryarchaeota archaeon]
MNLLKLWNNLGNKFGEGIIILVTLVAVYFLVSIYSLYTVRLY